MIIHYNKKSGIIEEFWTEQYLKDKVKWKHTIYHKSELQKNHFSLIRYLRWQKRNKAIIKIK